MKIDVYNHILPGRFKDVRGKNAPSHLDLEAPLKAMPALWDVEARFKIMDRFDEYVQVLTLGNPPPEILAGPEDSPELCRIANDEMAELVARHPDRFLGGIASLPMNNMDAALEETDRAIGKLGLKGVQVFSPMKGQALDAPEFFPLFEKMAEYDLPILLHPGRTPKFADYPAEEASRYRISQVLGWPYDTAVAMTRLICIGLFDRLPNIKILTHHLGGIVPYVDQRLREGFDKVRKTPEGKILFEKLKQHPHEYLTRFYGDTVTTGSIAALQCGLAFFGEDRVLFATDMPFDTVGGSQYVEDTIRALSNLPASPATLEKIYEGNARRLFQL